MSLTAWIISAALVGGAIAILVWIHKEAKAYKREKEEIAQRLRDEAREQEEALRRQRASDLAGNMQRAAYAGHAQRRIDKVQAPPRRARREDTSYAQPRRRDDEPYVDPYVAAAPIFFAAQDSAPSSDSHSASGWSGGGGDSGGAGASGSWDSGSSDSSSSSSYDSGSSSDSGSFSSD